MSETNATVTQMRSGLDHVAAVARLNIDRLEALRSRPTGERPAQPPQPPPDELAARRAKRKAKTKPQPESGAAIALRLYEEILGRAADALE